VPKDSVIESAHGGVFLVHGPRKQPLVSGKHNSINCPAGRHFYEGR
jgi:hypothetical protein